MSQKPVLPLIGHNDEAYEKLKLDGLAAFEGYRDMFLVMLRVGFLRAG